MHDLITSTKVLKILIIGPSWVGDMVLAQSLFKTLALEYRNAKIDVLAPEWSCQLLALMPEVNQAITMPIGHGELKLKLRFKIAQALKKEGYDWSIVLPNSLKSALIPWLANIPKRTGWRGELRYGLLTDMRLPDHVIFPVTARRYVALGLPASKILVDNFDDTLWPKPLLYPSKKMIQAALKFFGITLGSRVLALCPGAEFGQAKKWPAVYFQDLARHHIKQGGDVWLFGSQADRQACNDVEKGLDGCKVRNFAGETSLTEVVALLSQADQVVANDSGLMHIAAALDRQVVGIYGSTSEKLTPPLSSKSRTVSIPLDCRPCFKRKCPYGHYRCLKDLKPEIVLGALAQQNL